MRLQLITTCAILALSSAGELHGQEKLEPHIISMEAATLADYKQARDGKYSQQYLIKATNPVFLFSKQQDGLGKATIAVQKKGAGYLSHGVTDKFHKDMLDKGIPIEKHPEMLVMYPPEKLGAQPLVIRYILKERC